MFTILSTLETASYFLSGNREAELKPTTFLSLLLCNALPASSPVFLLLLWRRWWWCLSPISRFLCFIPLPITPEFYLLYFPRPFFLSISDGPYSSLSLPHWCPHPQHSHLRVRPTTDLTSSLTINLLQWKCRGIYSNYEFLLLLHDTSLIWFYFQEWVLGSSF